MPQGKWSAWLSPRSSNPQELSKGRVKGKASRQRTTNGSHTFRERFPSYLYLRREPRSSWTQGFKFRWSLQRALLTLKAPRCPHWTAASIHSVSAWDLWRALLIFMLQVATLQANVCWAIKQYVERERASLVHCRGILFQNPFTGQFAPCFCGLRGVYQAHCIISDGKILTVNSEIKSWSKFKVPFWKRYSTQSKFWIRRGF